MKLSTRIIVALIFATIICMKTNAEKYYTVLPGDTLSKIALQNNTSVAWLCHLNGKPDDWWLIRPGERIMIDGPDPSIKIRSALTGDGFYLYKVRSGDSIERIAQERRVTVDDICKWNDCPTGYDKIIEGMKIRIAQKEWIDWNNPNLKIVCESRSTLPSGDSDWEVSVNFSNRQVQWCGFSYQRDGSRKIIKKHTHICGKKCWENVREMFQNSKCEEWEDYFAYNHSVCDGGASILKMFDKDREIISAYSGNSPLPKGQYQQIIKGAENGGFCIKSGDCRDVD